MKCEIHVEITISQTHSNSTTRHKSITTLRLVFARKIRVLSNGRTQRRTSQTLARVDPKKIKK